MAWTVKTTASTIGKAVDGKWNRETGSRGPETMPVARIAPARGGWVRWNRTGMRGRWTCGTKDVLVVHAAPNPSPGDPDPNTETEKNPLDFPQVRDASRQCSAQSTRTCATSGAIGPRNRLPGRRRREKGSCDAQPGADETKKQQPQEWMKANPSRRPDIFPEFEPMKPPLPQPMPGDPEEPEEEEEEEEEEKEEPEEEPEEEPKPEEE